MIKQNGNQKQLFRSLSGPGAAPGGIMLRMCVKVLEFNDGDCRKHWVVIHVGTVNTASKHHRDKMAQMSW